MMRTWITEKQTTVLFSNSTIYLSLRWLIRATDRGSCHVGGLKRLLDLDCYAVIVVLGPGHWGRRRLF
jgi:hypothetical protein